MKKNGLKYLLFLLVLATTFSCSPTKYVQENEYLLDKNKIVFEKESVQNDGGQRQISLDDLLPILKQKPNRKVLFGIRFHLRIYSLSNEERIQKRKLIIQKKTDKKNLKVEEKNKKRAAKDKPLKQYKVVKTTFGEGLRNSGEAPVILDSLKIEKSVKQINNQLINRGYFNNEVRYEVVLGKHQKAEVKYIVKEGKPYTIKSIDYLIKDSVMGLYVDSIKKDSYLKIGDNFNTDKMDAERVRLNKYLLNKGYHFFNREFIYFRIDSSLGTNQVNVSLGIQNYKVNDVLIDSIVEIPHRQYVVKEIKVIVDYDPNDEMNSVTQLYQKVVYENVEFYYKKKLKYKLKLLYDAILIQEGDLYNKSQTEATYRKFSGLGVFKSVSIQFDTVNNGLLARVVLQPVKTQSFNVSSDGLHNNGLYGVEGSMTYAHRNVFGGAERLQISFSGGLEAQKLLIDEENSDNNLLSNANFNTVEFGPRVGLVFPRFLFLNKYFDHISNAKTELSTSYNYQQRPDFTRGVQDVSMTWVWHEKAPITYKFTPLSLSAINITKEQAFQDKINALNDRFLAASYDNNIIAGGRLAFEYNGQQLSKNKNVFYTSATVEGAGNMLRGIYKMSNQEIDTVTDSYSLFGIRFAQFVKFSLDARYYRKLFENGRSKIVYRIAGGMGVPLSNLNEALPFQKSFFSGGANGMRAWKSRTLGPGAYYDSTGSFDKIGDIQLESNMELRFPIISWIEGAWFVDAGNIWLIHEDSLRTNAHFDATRFMSEVAIGTGLGLRMDLDFFIIRFDFSMPFRNPALPVSERWLFQGGLKGGSVINGVDVNRSKFFKLQFNLGIGYPF